MVSVVCSLVRVVFRILLGWLFWFSLGDMLVRFKSLLGSICVWVEIMGFALCYLAISEWAYSVHKKIAN